MKRISLLKLFSAPNYVPNFYNNDVFIQAKYVLLREMAGIGLMSIDADDLDDVCGKGPSSLLNTIHNVLTNLDRKPRQLIVTSLEQVITNL